MKLIFLDIDGVLNSEDFFNARVHTPEAKKKWTEESDFDPDAVSLLNHISDATGANFVVTSAWRIGRTVSELQDLFKRVGITGKVVGRTRSIGDERRDEIQEWIDSHDMCEAFVVIDDEYDMGLFTMRFVKTNWKHGLEHIHMHMAIDLLNE